MQVIIPLTIVYITLSLAQCGEKTDYSNDTSTKNIQVKDKDGFDLMALITDCNETFRIEMSYLESLNTSGSFPDETDRTPKCFLRCLLETSEVLSEKDVFDVPRTAAVFSIVRRGIAENDVEEMAAACSERSETCKCERSYQYLKCLFETEIKKYEN